MPRSERPRKPMQKPRRSIPTTLSTKKTTDPTLHFELPSLSGSSAQASLSVPANKSPRILWATAGVLMAVALGIDGYEAIQYQKQFPGIFGNGPAFFLIEPSYLVMSSFILFTIVAGMAVAGTRKWVAHRKDKNPDVLSKFWKKALYFLSPSLLLPAFVLWTNPTIRLNEVWHAQAAQSAQFQGYQSCAAVHREVGGGSGTTPLNYFSKSCDVISLDDVQVALKGGNLSVEATKRSLTAAGYGNCKGFSSVVFSKQCD